MRLPIICVTGRCERSESPRLPRSTMPVSQRPYCTCIGTSSPSAFSSAARSNTSAPAVPPPTTSAAMASITSTGSRRTTANTISDTMNSVTMTSSSRRIR